MQEPKFIGVWEGELTMGPMKQPATLVIDKNRTGSLTLSGVLPITFKGLWVEENGVITITYDSAEINGELPPEMKSLGVSLEQMKESVKGKMERVEYSFLEDGRMKTQMGQYGEVIWTRKTDSQ